MDAWLWVRERVSIFITMPPSSTFWPPSCQKAFNSRVCVSCGCVRPRWFIPVKAKEQPAKGRSRDRQCTTSLTGILFTLLLLALITCFFELNNQLSLESLVPAFRTRISLFAAMTSGTACCNNKGLPGKYKQNSINMLINCHSRDH